MISEWGDGSVAKALARKCGKGVWILRTQTKAGQTRRPFIHLASGRQKQGIRRAASQFHKPDLRSCELRDRPPPQCGKWEVIEEDTGINLGSP